MFVMETGLRASLPVDSLDEPYPFGSRLEAAVLPFCAERRVRSTVSRGHLARLVPGGYHPERLDPFPSSSSTPRALTARAIIE